MCPTLFSRRAFFSALAAVLSFQASIFAAPAEAALNHASLRGALAAQNAHTARLMRDPSVLGTAVGLTEEGVGTIIIYVEDTPANAAAKAGFAATINGVPVTVELTDKFRALAKPSGAPVRVSHTAKQTVPIQLGTSGGWQFDLANGFCCGGTLGSLIQVNGVQYILSNYHVMEADIVSGGNNLIAQTGNPTIQPGLIDVNCNAAGAQEVGTLVKLGSLPNSNVDVGIAQANPGMVRSDGAILEIGTISAQTIAAAVNKGVKKSGRTSGLTQSKITGLNATISVAYENECAGGAAFTKTFFGQILIANKGSSFLKGGDSGSLMVENVASSPRAIGLLYAGSSSIAVANPITEVLEFIGTKLGGVPTMVGQ